MSPIVYAAALAWVLSQLLKVVVAFLRSGRGESSRVVWRLVWAGGMPSSHSALTAATLVMVGLLDGPSSSVFGLAFVLTVIVVYDRTKLHHMYKIFQNRFPTLAEKVEGDPVMKDLVGHTVSEVLVGILVGILAAAVTWACRAP